MISLHMVSRNEMNIPSSYLSLDCMCMFFFSAFYLLFNMSALSEMKKMRMLYSAAFKLKVISFAKNANNSAASWQFGISEKLVQDWQKKQSILENIPRSKKALWHGKAIFFFFFWA